jgi:hypothetical protein
VKRTSFVSDYDKFVAFCTSELDLNQADEALSYFDNRFYNRRVDNQTGHLRQAFYAAKEFFSRFPGAKRMGAELLDQGRLQTSQWPHLDHWKRFVANYSRIRLPEGGKMETVHKILPTSLGGIVEGGGGAGPSFKVVIPLVARYLARGSGSQRNLTPIGADIWEDVREENIQPTRRTRFMTSRIIRDSQKSLDLKVMYEHRCQVCQRRIQVRRGDFYSEAHHLRPLGGRHSGPDIKPNMLVLCPWHHAEFDYFLFFIDSHRNLSHRLRRVTPNETTLKLRGGHRLGNDFIEYNNTYFKKLAAGT